MTMPWIYVSTDPMLQVLGGRSWAPTGESRSSGRSGGGGGRRSVLSGGGGWGGGGARSRKKMSLAHGNIHPLAGKRALTPGSDPGHDLGGLASPGGSPAAQRRSLAVPPSFMLSSLMTRLVGTSSNTWWWQ